MKPQSPNLVAKTRSRLKWRIALAGLFVASLLAAVGFGPVALHTYRLNRATKALRDYDLDAAADWLNLTVASRPDCPTTHYLLARLARRRGLISNARDSLQRAARLGFDPDRIQRERWLIHAQLGELSDAEPHLHDLLSNPRGDEAAICEAFVNGYLRNYRFGDALPMIDAWQTDLPGDAQAPFCRGLIWLHMKLTKKAAAEFEQALQLAPHRQDIRRSLAAALTDLHRYDEADRLFAECYADDPNDLNVLIGWANCRLALGDGERARELLEDAARLDGQSRGVLLLRGRLEIAAGHAEDAIPWLDAALEQNPRDPDVRYELGTALQMLGRLDEARRHLEFAQAATQALSQARELMGQIQENPRLVEPRYQVGTTLLEYGAVSDGLAWLNSVLQIDPTHEPTRQALAAHHAELHDGGQ